MPSTVQVDSLVYEVLKKIAKDNNMKVRQVASSFLFTAFKQKYPLTYLEYKDKVKESEVNNFKIEFPK